MRRSQRIPVTAPEVPTQPNPTAPGGPTRFRPGNRRGAAAVATTTAALLLILLPGCGGPEIVAPGPSPREMGRNEEAGLADRLCISPDGQWIATATRAGEVAVTEVATRISRLSLGWGEPARTIAPGPVILAFSQDARLLFVGGRGRCGAVYEVATGKRLSLLRGPGGERCAAFGAQGRQLLTDLPGGGVAIWDAGTGERRWVHAEPAAPTSAVAWLPDGRIAAGREDGVVKIGPPDQAPASIVAEHPRAVSAVAGVGNTIASIGGDLRLTRPDTGEIILQTQVAAWPDTVLLPPTLPAAPDASVWNPIAGRQLVAAALSPDGTRVAWAESRTLRNANDLPLIDILDLRTGRTLESPQLLGDIRAVGFAQGGRTLVTTGQATRFWNARQLQRGAAAEIPAPASVAGNFTLAVGIPAPVWPGVPIFVDVGRPQAGSLSGDRITQLARPIEGILAEFLETWAVDTGVATRRWEIRTNIRSATLGARTTGYYSDIEGRVDLDLQLVDPRLGQVVWSVSTSGTHSQRTGADLTPATIAATLQRALANLRRELNQNRDLQALLGRAG